MEYETEKLNTCRNCGRELPEACNFCPGCGQDNHSHKQPVFHFLLESLENIFHFDTKLFTTLRDLFKRPGLATLNYNNDKRARYVPPVRLYVFTSFLFFLLLSFTKPDNISIPEPDIKFNNSDSVESMKPEEFLTPEAIELLSNTNELKDNVVDSLLRENKMEQNAFNRSLIHYIHSDMSGLKEKEAYRGKLFKNISLSMFFLMPVFALLLTILFRKSKLFYTEHLVFSLHFHTVIFILLMIWIGISFITDADLAWVMLSAIALYLVLALHQVHRQTWTRTIIKSLFIIFIYSICITASLVISAVLSAI